MSRAIDGKSFSNISASTAQFTLDGGTYGADFIASAWGQVTFQKLAADGSTWVTAATTWSANGTALVQLPFGIYRFYNVGATGVYVTIRRIPGE